MKKELKILLIENKKYIVLDNEAFDWGIDPDQLKILEVKIKDDPAMRDNYIGTVFHHFASSFSEFAGKHMTLKDINDGLEKGYIE